MQNETETDNADKSKKKVEWSQNLSSVESFVSETRSPNWDNDTDHLLSYFLEDQMQSGFTSPMSLLGTPSPPSGNGVTTSMHSSSQSRQQQHAPFTATAGLRGGHRSSAADNEKQDGEIYDDDPVPPPTPATHYYHHGSNPNGKSSKSSMPSSILRNRNAPIFHAPSEPGFPNGVDSPALDFMDNISPLSPAGLLGTEEQLMLPPPPASEAAASAPTASAQKPQGQPQQSHLQWLQHINALAQQSSPAPTTTAAPQPPPQQQQQQQQQHQQQGGIPFPNVQGLPAMAAGFVQAPMYYAQAALKHLQQQAPQPESEEKRAKRLERNRESARKSRLRKKLRLSQVEEKVAGLHAQIEASRSEQINQMNSQLQEYYVRRFSEMDATKMGSEEESKEEISKIIQGAGTNSAVQRAVVDFQYNLLGNTLLPRYQKFLLWLTLHQEEWFTTGKENHNRRDTGKANARSTSGKISSKQVGESLTNAWKEEGGNESDKPSLSAEACDNMRMWPLLCFELSVSVDQEERLVQQAFKIANKVENLAHVRAQMEAASRMASGLREAVLLQSHNATVRRNQTYLGVLTPEQTIRYQQWLEKNKGRYSDKQSQDKPMQRAPSPLDVAMPSAENMTLMEVCRKLEEVLKISKVTDEK
eukprot:Nitzschia sp. Nitz4//scaffold51_size120721//113363//115439//NITZ4_003749-RA/size120721-snap-gene-0.28-mRNA-1//1//CDS//3329553928//4575//frame0